MKFAEEDVLGADGLVRRDDAKRETSRLERLTIHPVRIEIAGVVVEVRFEWANAAEVYRRRYRHMLSTRKPRFVAHVAGRKAGEVYFWVSGVATYFWGHSQLGPNEISFLMDAVVNTTVFTTTNDLITLHAALVGDGASAAAIVGTTTAGKSTTAIACARRGLELFSDEFCSISPRGALPCPRALNLRQGGIELLAEDAAPASAIDAWLRSNRGADRDNVGYDDLFGELRVPSPHPLRLAFIIVGTGAQPRVRPIPPARMLVHVEPWTRMKLGGLDGAATLFAFLRNIASYELTLGKPDDTARTIAGMLAAAQDGGAATEDRRIA